MEVIVIMIQISMKAFPDSQVQNKSPLFAEMAIGYCNIWCNSETVESGVHVFHVILNFGFRFPQHYCGTTCQTLKR